MAIIGVTTMDFLSYLSKSSFVLSDFDGNDYTTQFFDGYKPKQAAAQSPTITAST
ncbi:hypothetical protein [Oryza sativa Japonica Group]|uniref:Uncharacterized protein n=1 Tax=Oryza sativa subsp. japonica TaxID=39947 RepID=Q5VNL9_ORYSJ|nr:hypothetical protein [Oryza sativa Japonica Group]BAD68956.1 hypothetical protein [Oryza sativa Japonica Group]